MGCINDTENEDKTWCVYCHINKINDKRYVGITNNTKRRWRGNGIEYKPDRNDNQNRAFWNAIKKYGWKNFEHIILIDNLSLCEAKEKEIYYIKKYKTFIGFFKNREDRLGYNSTLGGDGTKGLSGKLHHNYGKHLSYEQKELIRKNNSIKIDEYNINGNYIKEWNSETSACNTYGIDPKTMWEILNGAGRYSYKGKVFRYKHDSFDKFVKKDISGENHSMYRRKHSEVSKKKMSINRAGKCKGKDNHNSHKVYYDGIIFPCIRECSEYIDIKYNTLRSWLCGQNSMPDIYKDKQLMYYEDYLNTAC